MYLFERLMWSAKIESAETREKWDAQVEKELGKPKWKTSDPDKKAWGAKDQVEVEPTDAESLYVVNETFLDVRAAFQEEKRGLITLFFASVAIGVNGYMFLAGVLPAFLYLIRGSNSLGDQLTLEAYVAYPLIVLTWCAANYVFWKYAWPWIRVELFTQRHLIARFNRKARQVYLNRPGYAGGVVVMPWGAAVAGINPEDPDHLGMSGFLVLAFPDDKTGAGYDEAALLGRPMHGNREIEGLWEYIRRYMEEGLQAVPKPKRLLPLWPSPVEPVRATLRFMSPLWRSSGKPVALLTGLVLSPLLVLHALCHWISLLLCWKPRWPREIREAGLPGKPVPKLTTADDYGPELAERLRHNARKDREEMKPRRRRKREANVNRIDEVG